MKDGSYYHRLTSCVIVTNLIGVKACFYALRKTEAPNPLYSPLNRTRFQLVA